jgi:hypothetical protein
MIRFIVFGILAFISAGYVRADEGEIHLSGGAVVLPPAEGYKWTARTPEPGATEKLEIYIAAKEGSFSKVMLIVNPSSQNTDEKRLNTIANAVAGNISSIKSQGFTEIRTTKPEAIKPIGDRVSFVVSGLARSGKVHYYFYNTIIFGKKTTYQFQAISRAEDEAKALIKVVDTMKESTDK